MPDIAAVLNADLLRPPGRFEDATVPDTLDLGDRAELAINALTRGLKPDEYYAVTQTFRFDTRPPFDDSANWMTVKFVRALPLMRAMCGSEAGLDIEQAAMRAILEQIRDRQMYFPISADGPPGGTAYPVMTGIGVLALMTWYGRDGNGAWLDWVRSLCDGLKTAAIPVGDYAYVPPECSLSADGRWHWTLRGEGKWPPGYIPYTPPEEPICDQQGFEGAVKWEQSNVIKALVRCYELTGDQEALEHAQKLARFCLKPALWEKTEEKACPGHEHGLWAGHFHGNMGSLQALLYLAIATEDERLKQLVREGYEHGRRHGVIRLGFVPSWIHPTRVGRSEVYVEMNEGCGAADTLILAAQLTDAGLGDYWDDVDHLIRNHLAELQIIDVERMRADAGGDGEFEPILERFVGGFTQATLTCNDNSTTHGCCTANGSLALYHAWEGITRFDSGVATVNLFLNRATPWLAVESYLPYEGKVLLRNKLARTVMARIPAWLDARQLTCSVNNAVVKPPRSGHYAIFDALKAGDEICLEFPLPEHSEQYTIRDTTYTATFRGSTVVDLLPRKPDPEIGRRKYPFFQRNHFRVGKAPLRQKRRFIAESLIPRY